MKIDNEKLLLEIFTEQDEETYRLWTLEPFEQDGYIVATDTRALIRVMKELTEGEYKHRDDPNVAIVIPKPNPQFAITREELRKVLTMMPNTGFAPYFQRFCDCPECDGRGDVEYEYRHKNWSDTSTTMAECPVCGGDGRAYVGYDTGIDIRGKVFVAQYIILLHNAMSALNADVVKVTPAKSGWMFQPQDGIDILIMPTEALKAKYKLNQ